MTNFIEFVKFEAMSPFSARSNYTSHLFDKGLIFLTFT
jgi:hypothetical protein